MACETSPRLSVSGCVPEVLSEGTVEGDGTAERLIQYRVALPLWLNRNAKAAIEMNYDIFVGRHLGRGLLGGGSLCNGYYAVPRHIDSVARLSVAKLVTGVAHVLRQPGSRQTGGLGASHEISSSFPIRVSILPPPELEHRMLYTSPSLCCSTLLCRDRLNLPMVEGEI